MTVIAQRTVNVYERPERDFVKTPLWVTEQLIERAGLDKGCTIWEPAAGDGAMSNPLIQGGFEVYASDIEPQAERVQRLDFLRTYPPHRFDAIVTNPPFNRLGVEFVKRSLAFMNVNAVDRIMLLLPAYFDYAGGRKPLFGDNPYFCRKIVLTKRIKWFADGRYTPREHHAWFEWRNKPSEIKGNDWW